MGSYYMEPKVTVATSKLIETHFVLCCEHQALKNKFIEYMRNKDINL